jgi:hypothetical protein
LRVRLLEAQGNTLAADAMRLQLAQQREYADAVKNGADPATLALLAQVQAQEKLTAATNKANGAALNMVQGYKLQAAIFDAMAPRGPIVPPPSAPRSTPTTGTSGGNGSGDEAPFVFVLDGEIVARTVVKRGKANAPRNGASATEWWKGFN